MAIKTIDNDCFAYPKEGEPKECFAMTIFHPDCGTVDCPFYKPDSKLIRKEDADGKVYFERAKRSR